MANSEISINDKLAEPKSAVPADRDAGLSMSAWWLGETIATDVLVDWLSKLKRL